MNYDALNRVNDETQVLDPSGDNLSRFINYDHFKNGNRKQLIYPSTKTINYTYDANNRLELVKIGSTTLAQYAYDPIDRRDTKTFDLTNDLQTNYAFDYLNQLTSLANTILPSTNISTYAYPQYDKVSNRKQMDHTFQANPLVSTTYNYNDIYELTDVNSTPTYSYDNVGNRLVASGVNYTPNNLNQYSQVGATTYSYDGNGNLTDDGPNTYTYDAQNRLTTFNDGSTTTNYKYDAFNRRVKKDIGGTEIYFVYDGDDIIAEYDDAGNLEAEYIHGEQIDEILTMERSSNIYYYFQDGLGSVTEITNSSGTVQENYTYDPYGTPSVVNSTIGNPFRFTGQEFDEESGLHHYNRRTYSSTIGRFLQRDPIGNFDSENLYQYTLSNPINYVDPTGEIVDTLADIGFIGYDLYKLVSDSSKGCKDNFKGNLAALGGDVLGAFIPGLTGVGLAIREVKFGRELATKAVNPKLQNVIKQLFRTKDRIPGGTAGAIRHELKTGEIVGGKSHIKKRQQRSNELSNIIRKQSLTPQDRQIAEGLLKDLKGALGGN